MASFRSRSGPAAVFVLLALLLASIMAGCGTQAPVIEMVAVPGLTGLTVQDARVLLQEEGLETGETLEEYSATVPPGEIISSTPSTGDELDKGTPVDLTVSKGPETIPVPALLGSAEADALAALQAQGFQAEVQRIYNESVGAGLVCAMEPVPNTTALRGSKIVVTISLGSAYVSCSTCGGDGTIATTTTCPDCGGSGECYT
jgi:beta-lactam-binding protein with PASTA domain